MLRNKWYIVDNVMCVYGD